MPRPIKQRSGSILPLCRGFINDLVGFKGRNTLRYFFNIRLEGDLLPDREGQDFPDADAAWEAARAAAGDLMESAILQPTSWQNCSFEVTDEEGQIVLEFPFLEAIEIPDPSK
jgi:hypothetical protein